MRIPDIYRDIITDLTIKTQAGKAVWNKTATEAKYLIYFKNFGLTVYSEYDQQDQEEFVRFDLINTNGEDIDGFYISEKEADYGTALELHSLARRAALEIDKAIKEIAEELASDNVAGLKEDSGKDVTNDSKEDDRF